jgi:serine/threonine protein kinase
VSHQKSNKKIDRKKVCEWTLQMGRGLRDLHKSHRLIHRDVKPANVFLTSSGHVKLGDLPAESLVYELIRVRTQSFDYSYMSPEMLANSQEYTVKSDIWSLGCTLYELVYLKTAFPEPFENQSVDSLEFRETMFTNFIKK